MQLDLASCLQETCLTSPGGLSPGVMQMHQMPLLLLKIAPLKIADADQGVLWALVGSSKCLRPSLGPDALAPAHPPGC